MGDAPKVLWIRPLTFKLLLFKNQFDLLSILARSGIVPNGKFYERGKIVEAITKVVNLRPLIECEYIGYSLGHKYVLRGIYFCLDKYGQSFVPCLPPSYLLCGFESDIVRFDPPPQAQHKNSVLISSNATTTSAAIGIQ